MANFEPAFDFMLPHEGGYVKNPNDPGGETRYGISKRSYPKVDIASLTVDDAKEIYRRDFWLPTFDRINSQAVANKAFDFSVNMGHQQAIKLLQSACNECGEMVAVDGTLGNITLNAINSADEVLLLTAYKKAALGYYQHLAAVKPSLSCFLVGWCKRAMA